MITLNIGHKYYDVGPLIDPEVLPLVHCPLVNRDGDTPLHLAARRRDDAEVVRLLIDGAAFLIKNKAGQYPLTEYAKHSKGATTLWSIKDQACSPREIEKLCAPIMLLYLLNQRNFKELQTLFDKEYLGSNCKNFVEVKSKNHSYTPLMILAMLSHNDAYLGLMKSMIDYSTLSLLRHKDKDKKTLANYLEEFGHVNSLAYLNANISANQRCRSDILPGPIDMSNSRPIRITSGFNKRNNDDMIPTEKPTRSQRLKIG